MRSHLRMFAWLLGSTALCPPSTLAASASWPADPTINVQVPLQTWACSHQLWAVPDSGGGIVVVDSGQGCGNTSPEAMAQRVDVSAQPRWSAGVPFGDGPLIRWSPEDLPSVASDGSGGVFVASTVGGRAAVQHVSTSGQRWDPFIGVTLSTDSSSAEMLACVASDHAGGAVVFWFESRPDGAGGVITGWFAQRVDGSGSVEWAPGGILVAPSGVSSWASAVGDGTGGAILAWSQFGSMLWTQRVDSHGVARWAAGGPGGALLVKAVAFGTVNGDDPDDPFRRDLVVVSDGDGGAIVPWVESSAGNGLYAQRIDSSGVASWAVGGVSWSTSPVARGGPRIAPDLSGGMIGVWEQSLASSRDVYAQRIDGTGAVRWGVGGIAICAYLQSQSRPCIAPDGHGGAVMAWVDERQGPTDIYAQRVDSAGAYQWTPGGAAVCTAAGIQDRPKIASDGDGGAVVVWDDAARGGVFAQRAPVIVADPVLVSLVRCAASPSKVDLAWMCSGADSPWVIEHAIESGPWDLAAEVRASGSGLVEWQDRDVRPGEHRRYRIGTQGTIERFGEVGVEIPVAPKFALDGALPNPSSGAVQVALSLDSSEPARLELFDPIGRRVFSTSLNGLEPGYTRVRLSELPCSPGVYLLRLTQGGRHAETRVTRTR